MTGPYSRRKVCNAQGHDKGVYLEVHDSRSNWTLHRRINGGGGGCNWGEKHTKIYYFFPPHFVMLYFDVIFVVWELLFLFFFFFFFFFLENLRHLKHPLYL